MSAKEGCEKRKPNKDGGQKRTKVWSTTKSVSERAMQTNFTPITEQISEDRDSSQEARESCATQPQSEQGLDKEKTLFNKDKRSL